jgi:cellulose synthase/poly-beta-1,6-N-acetylglucosamine synthase-like glycosyltransferase
MTRYMGWISDKLTIVLFLIIGCLWFMMVFFTLSHWLMNTQIPMNKDLDIYLLTTVLMGLVLIQQVVWFSIYLIYPFAYKKAINHQLILMQNKKLGNRCPLFGNQSPLVSIVIAARNEENVIRKTVLNCLQQRYKNFEVIVVCHNCSDRTYDEVQVNDNRVRALDLRTVESGKGIALNHGLEYANGEYIAVLDADGRLSEGFIENILPLFDEGYAAVQGKIMASNSRYNIITNLLSLEGDLFSLPYMTVKNFLDKRVPLGGTGFVIRKDLLIKEGKFSNGLIDDFELTFKLFRKKYRTAFAPLSVVYDEKPPEFGILFRQRARWIRGHINLVNHRIPEYTDIFGIIYWLSPISMICGLSLIGITSYPIIHYMFFGLYPYTFAYMPITIWIATAVIAFSFQVYILFITYHSTREVRRNIMAAAVLIPFSNYWYVCLIKAFFVKSWASTKTKHGYEVLSSSVENVVAHAILKQDVKRKQ